MSPDGSFVLGGLFSMTYELTAAVSSFEEPHKVRVELPGTGEPVEILVTTRCAVSGSVVDPYGRAVGGAEVRAKGWDGPPGVESGADGRFRIEGVKPETHNLVAKARGWAPSEPTQIGMSASGSPEDVVLRLRPPGRIAGEVLAADGKPEADRPLRLERAGLQLDARSDSQGRFLFDELAPGDYSVFTRATELELARLPSRAKAESRNCSDPIPRGASIKLGEGEVANVTLKPDPPLANPIRVDGKVRCAGRPVEGCEISAFRLSPGSFAKSPEATSGADGRFQFRVDGPGPYSFSISPPRDAPTTKVRVEIESRGAVELVLEVPAGGIRGVTVDAEGRRVGDISLELEPEDASGGAIGSRGWLRSDGQGRFEFAHVAPGQYLITGESHDDALVHHGKTSRGGFIVSEGVALDEVKFVMLAGCRVEGTVRRPDGQPAAVALIRVREESGSQWLNQAAADSNGQYVLQGLPPGRYSIQAQTDRLASQETEPLSLGASAPSKIDLVLQEATDLDVVSLDAEGKVCFLMLELLDSRGRRSLSGRWLTRDSDARPTARRIGPLAPGTYTLRAMWPDGRALEQEVKLTGERTLELTLRPPN